MAEPRHFDDLTPEEQKDVLALARAQYAPMNTPSVAANRDAGTYVLPSLVGGVNRGYKALIDPLTEVLAQAANPLLHTLTEPLVTGTRMLQEGSLRPIGQAPSPMSSALPLSRSVAQAIVPQTPMEAGMLLGTAGAGRALKGAGQLRQAAGRVAGSAAGGELGSQIEGSETGRGAAWGAGLGLVGEGIGAVGGKAARSLPGAKTRIAEKDAAALGQRLERDAPGLPGARTSAELHEMASGGGRATLGARKEVGIQKIEAALQGQRLNIPAVSDVPISLREANRALSEVGARAFSKNPLDRNILGVDQRKLYGEIETQIEQGLADAHRRAVIISHFRREAATEAARPKKALPPRTEPGVTGPARTFEQGTLQEGALTIPRAPGATETPREATAELLRHVEAGVNPWQNVGGYPARPPIVIETSAQTARQIPGAPPSRMRRGQPEPPAAAPLGPLPSAGRADTEFIRIQDEYKQGITLLRHLLERPDAFRPGAKGVELNTPAIQKMLMNPKTRAALTNKLGADGFDRVVDTLTRGAGLGQQDILATGRGGFGTLAGQMFRGRNTGFNAPILAAGTAALPNIGSKYVGRQPYALTSGQQTALDLLMEKLGGPMAEESPR